MTMSTSQDLAASISTSRSEFLSSLPRWRRWLSMLNWHPVVDYEIREIEREQRLQQLQREDEQRAIESEQRRIAHEQRMQQLENEIAQVRKETEQLENEIAQLKTANAQAAELDSKIAALWPSSNSSSTPTTPPGSDSPI